MAVTRVFGSDGRATLNNGSASTAAGIHNLIANVWTAVVTQSITRVKGFGDNWSSCKGGTKTATGTIGGQLNFNLAKTSPNIAGISAVGTPSTAFLLTAATGCTYGIASTESVVMSSAGLSHGNEQDVTTNFAWEISSGDGVAGLAETWDETP